MIIISRQVRHSRRVKHQTLSCFMCLQRSVRQYSTIRPYLHLGLGYEQSACFIILKFWLFNLYGSVQINASSDNCLSNKVSTEDMSSANLVAKEADLSTIDVEALNDIRREVFPISPAPLSSAVPHSPVAESPVSLSPVVPHSPVVESTGLVSEELIRSCVTPWKVKKVQDTLQAEGDRYRCAAKLLPHFFSKEELTTCNTDGTHNKVPLDRTRLLSLKGNNL